MLLRHLIAGVHQLVIVAPETAYFTCSPTNVVQAAERIALPRNVGKASVGDLEVGQRIQIWSACLRKLIKVNEATVVVVTAVFGSWRGF